MIGSFLVWMACSKEAEKPTTPIAPAQAAEPTPVEGKQGKQGKSGKAGKGPGGAAGQVGPGGPGGGGSGSGADWGEVRLVMSSGNAISATGDQLHSVRIDHGRVIYGRSARAVTSATQSKHAHEVDLGTGDSSASVGADGDFVVVAFVDGRPPVLHAVVSTDGGKTFGPRQDLSGRTNGSQPAVRAWREGGSNRAVVTWFQSGGQTQHTVHASHWDGKAWSASRQLDAGAHAASFPAVAGKGDRTFVMWKEQVTLGPGAEPDVRLSILDGSNWSKAMETGLKGADPSVCVDGKGRAHVVSQRNLGTIDYAWSDDGKSWSKASNMMPGCRFAHIACNSKDQLVVVASCNLDGTPKLDLERRGLGFMISDDRGTSWRELDLLGERTKIRAGHIVLGDDGLLDLVFKDETTDGVERLAVKPFDKK